VSEEIELKLEFAPEVLPALLKSEPFKSRGIRFRPARQMVTTYYDSPKQALAKKGVFLRIRQDGKKITQAVKTAGEGGILAHRGEWEWPLTDPTPNLTLASETELKPILKRQKKNDLAPLFASEISRRIALVTTPDGQLELALDQGLVRAGRRTSPVSELEIEVKSGSAAAVFALASDIAAQPGTRIGFTTKAARGLALASNAKPAAAKAEPVELDAEMTPSTAAAAILDSCATQAAANLPIVIDHRLPDGIHQLRVALRRLRAALSLFKDELPSANRKQLRKDAGWLAGLLGPARDLDVMTGGALKAAMPPDTLGGDMRALGRVLVQARKSAWADAVEAVSSPRTSLMLIELAETAWFIRRELTDLAAPRLIDFAQSKLDERYDAAQALATDLDALTVEQRHELRLALKKLRYAADFFSGLFPPKPVRNGMRLLSGLQDALGGFNDAASVTAILGRAAEHAPPKVKPAQERAALFVSGWAAHRAALSWAEARAKWDEFAAAPRFWR
jgi:inorganic triphosphatase YgiF